MRSLQDEVRSIVEREGVIARRNHPALKGAVEHLARRGQLVAVLPGLYASAARATDRPIRLLALATREPDAVLVERTAAQLTFWSSLPGEEVTCAIRAPRPARRGFRFVRRQVPAELVLEHGRLRTTRPALTALDLCGELGGDAIDRVLRTRASTLAGLHRALELTGGRTGNQARRALLLDSRDEPWSAAERLCHRLLREAGIGGWRANRPVVVDGRLYYLDIAFPTSRLAVEIDGRLHETDSDVFENDRSRQNALVLAGWTVLRFTWAMLREHPESVVRAIRQGVRQGMRQGSVV